MLFLRIRPVIVFDGPPPQLKIETLKQRANVFEKQRLKVQKAAERLLFEHLLQGRGATIATVPIDIPRSPRPGLVVVHSSDSENENELSARKRRWRQISSVPTNFRGFTAERRALGDVEASQRIESDGESSSSTEVQKVGISTTYEIDSDYLESLPPRERLKFLYEVRDSWQRDSRRRAIHRTTGSTSHNMTVEESSAVQSTDMERFVMVSGLIEQAKEAIKNAENGNLPGAVQVVKKKPDSEDQVSYYLPPARLASHKQAMLGLGDMTSGKRGRKTAYTTAVANAVSKQFSLHGSGSLDSSITKRKFEELQSAIRSDSVAGIFSSVPTEVKEPSEHESDLESVKLPSEARSIETEKSQPEAELDAIEERNIVAQAGSFFDDGGVVSDDIEVISESSDEESVGRTTPVEGPLPEDNSPMDDPDLPENAKSLVGSSLPVHPPVAPVATMETARTVDPDVQEVAPPSRDSAAYNLLTRTADIDEEFPLFMEEDIDYLVSLEKEMMEMDNEEAANLRIREPSATDPAPPTLSHDLTAVSKLFESLLPKILESTNPIDHQQLKTDVQELLTAFGVPWVEAPCEAEAQCAELVKNKVCDAVVSDDSDALVFGAEVVLRKLFSDGVVCELYDSRKLPYTYEQLRNIAQLLGCDYSTGVSGIGVVNAAEILQVAELEGLAGLEKLKKWSNSELTAPPTCDSRELSEFKRSHNQFRKHWLFPSDFPNVAVNLAFSNPAVTRFSKGDFEWTKPNFDALCDLLENKCGFLRQKSGALLQPVIDRYDDARPLMVQTRIDDFFKPVFDRGAAATVVSKRLKKALNR